MMEGIYEVVVQMALGDMMYIQSFMKSGKSVQVLLRFFLNNLRWAQMA
jgi:hypothetical protein